MWNTQEFNCWFIYWLLTWSSYVICIAIHVPAVSQSVSQSVGRSGLLLNTVLPLYCLRQSAVWQRPEGHALTHKHTQKHTVSPCSLWRWVSMVRLDENELRGIVCMRAFMCIFVCVCAEGSLRRWQSCLAWLHCLRRAQTSASATEWDIIAILNWIYRS